MPISVDYVEDNTDDTGTELAWVSTLTATSALSSGDLHLILGSINSRNDGSNTDPVGEVEFRHGTTRIAHNRVRNVFGLFNAGDAAAGNVATCLALVTGNGTDTINVRRQGPGAFAGAEHRVGGQQTAAINMSELGTRDTHWWYSESPNDELADSTPVGTTYRRAADAALATTAAQDGEVQFTAPTTGVFVVMAYVEAWHTASAADTDQANVRLVQVTDPAGTPSSTTIGCEESYGYDATATEPEANRHTLCVHDYATLTAGTTYRFQIEAANTGTSQTAEFGRFRIAVIDVSRLANHAEIANAGGIVATSGSDNGANDLTFDFGATSHDVLVLASSGSANDGSWSHTTLQHDPAGTPTNYPDADGRFFGGEHATGLGASSHFAVLEGVTGSQTMRMVGTSDTAPEHRWGRNQADTADSRAVLIALQLDTAASDASGTAGGSSTTSAGASLEIEGDGSAAGNTTASAGASLTIVGSGTSDGAATTGTGATLTVTGSGAAAGASSTSAGASVDVSGSGTAAGSSTTSATATDEGPGDGAGSGTATGSSTTSAGATLTIVGGGSADGSATTAATGTLTVVGSGTATGSSTAVQTPEIDAGPTTFVLTDNNYTQAVFANNTQYALADNNVIAVVSQ